MVKHDISLDSRLRKSQSSVTDTGRQRILTGFDGGTFGLNEAGLEFYSLCDGERTLAQLSETLAAKYKVKAQGRDCAVMAFARYLLERDLLEVNVG